MVAGELHTLAAIGRVGDVQLAEVPPVAPGSKAAGHAAKVQGGVAAVGGGHSDGGICPAVTATLDHQITGQGIDLALQQNGLPRRGVGQRSGQVRGGGGGAVVLGSAGRGNMDHAVLAQGAQAYRLFHGLGAVVAELFKGGESKVRCRGELDLERGVLLDGVGLGQGLPRLDGQVFFQQLAVGVDRSLAVRIGLEHQGVLSLCTGGRAGDAVAGVDVVGGLQGPAIGRPGAGLVLDVGEGDLYAAGRCKAYIGFVGFLHGHGVCKLCIFAHADGAGVLSRDIHAGAAHHLAGGAVGQDLVLGGGVAVIGLFQLQAVYIALAEKLCAESHQGGLHIVGSGRLVGDDAGVAAHTQNILDAASVQGQLGAGDRELVGEVAAGAAEGVPHHQGKALLSVRGGVDVVQRDVRQEREILLGGVKLGVVEGQAVRRGVCHKFAAFFVDAAVRLDGAGI